MTLLVVNPPRRDEEPAQLRPAVVSSPARALAILELFTIERPTWTTDEINAALGYSRPTGYRYVKELVDTGLLRKAAAGSYALGPRLIVLDYQIRQTDPVLLASLPVMQGLVDATGLDAVLSAMFGHHLIDIHRTSNDRERLALRYGRGRPRPLFKGAAAKAIVANLPRAQQVRLYAGFQAEAAAAGLGTTWEEFRSRLAVIRKAGFHLSLGELEPSLGGAGVPIFDASGDLVAGLALVGPVARLRQADATLLDALLSDAAARIGASLS